MNAVFSKKSKPSYFYKGIQNGSKLEAKEYWNLIRPISTFSMQDLYSCSKLQKRLYASWKLDISSISFKSFLTSSSSFNLWTELQPFQLQKRSFSSSTFVSYRKKPKQVTNNAKIFSFNENSRKVSKRKMRILDNQLQRKSRDSKSIRQWRANIFRANTLPHINDAQSKQSKVFVSGQSNRSQNEQKVTQAQIQDQEEESEMMTMLKLHEKKVQDSQKIENHLRKMSNLDILPYGVEMVLPMSINSKKRQIYPILKLKKDTIPSMEFLDIIQNPFRKQKLEDALLLKEMQRILDLKLSSQLIPFFAAYETFFSIHSDIMEWILKHCKSRNDLWWCINYIRKREYNNNYLSTKTQTNTTTQIKSKAPSLLNAENGHLILSRVAKLGGLKDLYTVFGLLFESPIVNHYDFMQYANDEEFAFFANDKKWKLVPSSKNYLKLIEHAFMESRQPTYDIEHIVMSLLDDLQFTIDDFQDETRFMEYWIQAYLMGSHLDQALDVYRYYISSPITYEERKRYTTIRSTEKMEEPLREAIASSKDEKTYYWFCSNVCPHVLKGIKDLFEYGDENNTEIDSSNHKKSKRKSNRKLIRKPIKKLIKKRTLKLIRK